jgi:hypothetical protein
LSPYVSKKRRTVAIGIQKSTFKVYFTCIGNLSHIAVQSNLISANCPGMTGSKDEQLPPTATGEKQTIQARHGTATFVPKGHTIKIINTYGRQVVDTWAFALHTPPSDEEFEEEDRFSEGEIARQEEEGGNGEGGGGQEEEKVVDEKEKHDASSNDAQPEVTGETAEQPEDGKEGTKNDDDDTQSLTKSWGSYIPSVRGRGKTEASEKSKGGESAPGSAKGWSSYIPSIRRTKTQADPKEQKSWSSYIPSGQGFSSYLPSKDTLSAFAASHQRDPTKSVAEQLYDFSKTPVGAASLSGT